MKTIEQTIPHEKTAYLSSIYKDFTQLLFFDIETTGLSPKSASIYLIGCAFYTASGWVSRQYFAQTPKQEEEMLHSFCSFAAGFTDFVNFNGTTFDIPFIQARCKKYAIKAFEPANNIDIYRQIRPFKNLLHLSGCRQKQLEEYLGIYREDTFNGGELIELYQVYGETLDEKLLQILLLHNFEDIQGMLELSRIMAIPNLFAQGSFTVDTSVLQTVTDVKGALHQELQITLSLPSPLPALLSCHTEYMESRCFYFSGKDQKAILKLPIYNGELKYFYKDYKNYSYLPEEDQAMHKSVAVYVDKSRRMPATAANCYTRKSGLFLPYIKGTDDSLPVFLSAYKAKDSWILADEAFLSDQKLIHTYLCAVLKMF